MLPKDNNTPSSLKRSFWCKVRDNTINPKPKQPKTMEPLPKFSFHCVVPDLSNPSFDKFFQHRRWLSMFRHDTCDTQWIPNRGWLVIDEWRWWACVALHHACQFRMMNVDGIDLDFHPFQDHLIINLRASEGKERSVSLACSHLALTLMGISQPSHHHDPRSFPTNQFHLSHSQQTKSTKQTIKIDLYLTKKNKMTKSIAPKLLLQRQNENTNKT